MDGRIILKRVFESGMGAWLTIGTGGGLFENSVINLRVP
jgi:hypothetical protein